MSGFRFSGALVSARMVTGPFQGSWLNPLLPGDEGYVWTAWFDYARAAAIYQTGADTTRWVD